MNIERQRQILKEKHGLDIRRAGVLYQVSGVPRTPDGAPSFWMRSRIDATRNEVRVWFPARTGIRSRGLHNFVAAVTYAKAELNRIERLAAAKES